MWLSMEISKAASRAKYVMASNTSSCVPMDALTSTAEPQLKPMMDLIANVRLTTATPKYAWVNTKQIWGLATVNLATAKIHVESFLQ